MEEESYAARSGVIAGVEPEPEPEPAAGPGTCATASYPGTGGEENKATS